MTGLEAEIMVANSKISILEAQVRDKDREIEELQKRIELVEYFIKIGEASLATQLKKHFGTIRNAFHGYLERPILRHGIDPSDGHEPTGEGAKIVGAEG